jgi:hypothetical protein
MRREMGIIQCHLIKMELKGMKKNGMFDVHMKLDICYIFLSKFSRVGKHFPTPETWQSMQKTKS